ncbi:MAG: VCBS repeat-containing protein [Chitinophagales bacterium]|nr:VCBS repeat-containing protein [Chitinophagaceae bacterium]MCB9063702.1 VCBS repeat-containing protein [Chitinophagales bacterium]
MKRIIFLLSVGILSACSSDKKTADEGSQLAETYCVSCHSFPEPDLIDKNSWEQYMLPRMGMFLGIVEHDSLRASIASTEADLKNVEASGIFPTQPILSQEEWQKIKDFYIANAPDKIKQPEKKSITKGLKGFEVKVPEYKLSPPSITMARFDTVNHAIFLGDANSQSLMVMSSELQFLQGAKIGEGPVWMQELQDEYIITVMGSFSPTDYGSGYVLSLPKTSGKAHKVIDSLRRPTHSNVADLNGDGFTDIVTCEFAKWTGKLTLWLNDGAGKYNPKTLRNKPGAISSYIKDLNNDNRPDIIALFGQGDEGIFIYYNEGNGNFREETALRFPPSYGSTSFKLYDFNNDGHDDIVYTAGDNADFPPILKHYHGVYIFLNDRNNHFKQEHFLQLNGAYAAVPNDYDMDGDIDIAAISFFPDYQAQPVESFVYYENDGNNNFSLSTFDNPTMGRWIVMDAADYDGDGDKDIVLGSLAFEVVPPNGLVERWVEQGIPFIVLENKLK